MTVYAHGFPVVKIDHKCSRCHRSFPIDVIMYHQGYGGPEPTRAPDCPYCEHVEGDELPGAGYCQLCWRDSMEAVRVAAVEGETRCAVCVEEDHR